MVHVGSIDYQIPRNYIISFSPPQELQVTYPGFMPLTEDTRKCFIPNPHPEEAECSAIKFLLHTSRGLTTKERFENLRDIFRSQTPKAGPYGFELYEIGSEVVRIEVYRKDLPASIIVVECMPFDNHGKRAAVCEDLFQLNDRNFVRFFSPLRQLRNIEDIEAGIRLLMANFESKVSGK